MGRWPLPWASVSPPHTGMGLFSLCPGRGSAPCVAEAGLPSPSLRWPRSAVAARGAWGRERSRRGTSARLKSTSPCSSSTREDLPLVPLPSPPLPSSPHPSPPLAAELAVGHQRTLPPAGVAGPPLCGPYSCSALGTLVSPLKRVTSLDRASVSLSIKPTSWGSLTLDLVWERPA